MYRNAIYYRGRWLAPGSKGFELHNSNHPKAKQELEALIKQVDAAETKLTDKR